MAEHEYLTALGEIYLGHKAPRHYYSKYSDRNNECESL